MRRIGSLDSAALAERFRDYLTTQSIDASMDAASESGGSVNVWIRNEADLVRARELLDEFRASPADERFSAGAEANRIRQQKAADNIKKLKLRRSAPLRGASGLGRAMGGMMGGGSIRQQMIPVTIGIIVLSLLASFLTNFARPKPASVPGTLSFEEQLYCNLSFLDPREAMSPERGVEDPFASIKRGEVWRSITPLFMHGSTLHLLFNMMWIYSLGSLIERLQGSWFYVVLVLVSQLIGTLVQVYFPDALGGGANAIGASGAVYGLFGYLWIRPLVDPSFPVRMPPSTVILMLAWLAICFTPIIPNVANGAHLGGLIAGMGFAAAVGAAKS